MMLEKGHIPEKKNDGLTFGKVIGRIAIVLGVTVFIAAAAAGAAAYFIFRGPSETVRAQVVREAKETFVLSWIPDIFLSPEEVEQILGNNASAQTEQDDTLIHIDTDILLAQEGEPVTEEVYGREETPSAEPEETPEEDSGVRMTVLRRNGFIGYLLAVSDPGEILLGAPSSYGGEQESLESIADRYEALWAINAGSYGTDGITPEGFVISEGEILSGESSSSATLVGLDDAGMLHLGTMTAKEAQSAGIGNACVCDSILILNGKKLAEENDGGNSRGPMSAIGQKEDGTILFLVVDGWQGASLGATRADVLSIMAENDAKNAALLGCGVESGLMIDGELHRAVPEDSGEAPASAFVVPGR